jgi:hypothetical protein
MGATFAMVAVVVPTSAPIVTVMFDKSEHGATFYERVGSKLRIPQLGDDPRVE